MSLLRIIAFVFFVLAVLSTFFDEAVAHQITLIAAGLACWVVGDRGPKIG